MQEFLTQATIAVELLGAGYIASSFAIYTHRRINQPAHWEPRRVFIPEPPIARKPTLPKAKLPYVEQLRQECQKAGIKWRNAHGKNKHLKQAEMIEALRRLEQAKKPALPPPPKPAMAPHRKAA